MDQLPLFEEMTEPPQDEVWTDDGLPDASQPRSALHAVPEHIRRQKLEGQFEPEPGLKFCAFDLEIARPFELGRPYGISCAATLTSDGDSVLWHGAETSPDAPLPEQMNPREVQELAGYLADQQAQGYHVVTWNGLGFDFDVLAEEAQNELWTLDIEKLAMEHIDPAFQMLCDRGYMVGLETAGKGLNVGAKTEGMHGDLAPILWSGWPDELVDDQGEGATRMRSQIELLDVAVGTREAQDLCLIYVAQDAKLTADVYRAVCEGKRLPWIARSGRPNAWYPTMSDSRLLTVNEALEIPEPDTSWMSRPRLRSDVMSWIGKEA